MTCRSVSHKGEAKMTVARLIAIGFIFACVTVAWLILGGSIVVRTAEFGSQLAPRVNELWGPPLAQVAPSAYLGAVDKTTNQQPPSILALDSSDIKVDLDLDYRQKGLLWYSTYTVDFDGKYRFVNASDQPITTTVEYRFPARNTLYDNFKFDVNGVQVLPEGDFSDALRKVIRLGAHETADVRVTYRSRGVDNWIYKFGSGITNVKNFKMVAIPISAIMISRRKASRLQRRQ
jgi:hypothetical protein